MTDKKPLPRFASEDEEARWYYEHRHELDDYFGKPPGGEVALAEQLGLKRTAPRPASAPSVDSPSTSITIRLGSSDLAAVKAIAERRGLPYQTMLKGVIHEFVVSEGRSTEY